MNDKAQDWDIGRQGRRWTGPEGLPKLERLPGRLELVHGKLCFDEVERRNLLVGLMENMGLDEVVQFGNRTSMDHRTWVLRRLPVRTRFLV